MDSGKDINISAKGLFIADLKPGEILIPSIFGLESVELRKTRNDSPYLDMVLFDRTGSVRAKFWDRPDISMPDMYRELQGTALVRIDGKVQIFNEMIQVEIGSCRKIEKNADDSIYTDIIRSTPYDIDYLWSSIMDIIGQIENKQIKMLLEIMLKDERISEGLRVKPAAVKMHHAYRGGLLEHVFNVLMLIKAIKNSGIYRSVNWDLVIAAALVHDIGKIFELGGDQLSQGYHYSRCGILYGHIFIGASLINRYINEIEGFDENLKLELIHIILSHHGKLEWGSPVEMRTPEAILLHNIDYLDAQVSQSLEAIEKSGDDADDFTGRHLSPTGKQYYKSKL